MPKTDLVPCFYFEQDSQIDVPAKVLPRSEVRELKKQNKGFFIDHGNAFRLTDRECDRSLISLSGGDDDATDSVSGSSEPCISFAEMQANVGIVRDGVRNARGLVKMAQAKVCWYPLIRTYPELASGRWAQISA